LPEAKNQNIFHFIANLTTIMTERSVIVKVKKIESIKIYLTL